MTGSEFYTYVLKKFKRTDKSTEAYQATTDIIADIRLRLKTEGYKEEAYIVGITSLGDYRIALPSDFGHIIGEVLLSNPTENQNYGTLKKISKQLYDEKFQDRTLTTPVYGVPQYFCIYAGQLYLGPVPDKITYSYQINYTTESYTEVTSSTDPVPFTNLYRNIVRAGVLAELHDGLENYEESGYWRELYNRGVAEIEKNERDNLTPLDNAQYNGI